MPSPSSSAPRPNEASADAGSQPSARSAAELIAVTTRDDFLLEIGEALSGQTSVRPVDSIATALDQIAGSRRTQLIAVDARDISDLRTELERVNAQAPHIVTLVFAQAELEKQTAFGIKGTNAFAVLPIPIDRRKTAAVLEGAVADALARRPSSGGHRGAQSSDLRFDRNSSITVEPASSDPSRYEDFAATDSGNRKPIGLIGGAVAAVLVLAAAGWYFMSGSASAPAAGTANAPQASVAAPAAPASPRKDNVVPEPAPVVAEVPLIKGSVDELLEKARLAMRERRYTEPANDNALLYYRSAVKADASNGEATDGLRRVAGVMSARFDEALGAGRYDEATLALAHLKVATPDDPRVTALDGKLATAQISRMLAEGNLDRAASLMKGAQQSGAVPEAQIAKWRNEIARRQDEVRQKRLVDLAQDRIRDGRLNEGDDSAKAYLDQLKDLGPSAASAQQRVSRDLNAAYLRKARDAALANRAPEVDKWLAEAKAGGVSANEIAAFQRDLVNSRQKAAAVEADRLAGLAKDRMREGKLVEPANDNAGFYISALQAADASNSYVAAGSRELATKLLDRASTAGREGKSAAMDADLAQAKRWGADPKDIQAVQQASLSRKGGKSATSGSATAATGASSAQPENLQSRLKRTKYTAPEFPERALSQRVSGVVTVEFIVDKSGEPTDVRVVAAEPVGVFDRAAVSAVKRWRYEPVVVDGVSTEVPARTTIRFSLPSQ